MSWFRFCAIIYVVWGVAFFFLPNLSNEIFGVDYVDNEHAEDWIQLVGLGLFGLAFLLNAAHRSSNAELRRAIARGGLIITVSYALMLTYWQLIPDGPWNRLDIVNAVLLYVLSYGLFMNSELTRDGAVQALKSLRR
jgi:hypothetical protein